MLSEAKALRAILEKNKISCWMAPDDIPEDSDYITAVPNAIRSCSVFLMIITDKVNDSVWIPKELDTAVNFEKTIMPFVLEECDISSSFDFYLADIEKYNAIIDKDVTINNLVKSIKRVTNQLSNKILKPWLNFGPYKKLSDKEEFLSMNMITLFDFIFTIMLFFILRNTSMRLLPAIILSAIPFVLIWLIGGAFAPIIARTDNKRAIRMGSALFALFLGLIFFIAELFFLSFM